MNIQPAAGEQQRLGGWLEYAIVARHQRLDAQVVPLEDGSCAGQAVARDDGGTNAVGFQPLEQLGAAGVQRRKVGSTLMRSGPVEDWPNSCLAAEAVGQFSLVRDVNVSGALSRS